MLCCETISYLWWWRCKFHPPSMSHPSSKPWPSTPLDSATTSQKPGHQPHHSSISKVPPQRNSQGVIISLAGCSRQGQARQGEVRQNRRGIILSSLQQPVHTTLSIELPHEQTTKHHPRPKPSQDKNHMSENQGKTEQIGGIAQGGWVMQSEKQKRISKTKHNS